MNVPPRLVWDLPARGDAVAVAVGETPPAGVVFYVARRPVDKASGVDGRWATWCLHDSRLQFIAAVQNGLEGVAEGLDEVVGGVGDA